jgi:putative phosphoesterase
LKIGVISDTHGHLDPRVEKKFAGVDHILHAGDIGFASIILELEFVAPVTAVLGNCDSDLGFPLTAVVELGGKKILVHHIVNPHAPLAPLAERIRKEQAEIVIFGHTHKKFAQTVDGVLFLNPGYAGKPKPEAERSVAILHLEGKNLRTEFIPL